ncbi:hypothetical protein [Evansella cellulosilytica]|uniref:Uncharacterized protein n=1 Tax=Evansella cellulosilytica (strain ATCC 21833 / DSM 2522 / FERM P-1141 / JCM 9156 / N-4) TaxID=649639 RepID=E6U1K9_EVAC2|nr:hypothetical protein [Evansella cellulosilytica]ADU30372.1 hypothetical protein Bcell_2111 [Evansella cellulosilytica DSM 2522]
MRGIGVAKQIERDLIETNKSTRVFIQYVNASLFAVWIKPHKSRWIFYNISKHTDVSINVDVWRIVSVWVSDLNVDSPVGSAGANRVNPVNLTISNSQWEYAIRPIGAPDFMGGFHGDELLQNVLFLADGKSVSLQGLECNKFEIVQDTLLFDPTDGTTELAKVNVRHVFTPDGLRLISKIKWTNSTTIDLAYASMLPLQRGATITNRFRYIDKAVEHAIGSTGHGVPGENSYGLDIYNTNNKLGINMEIKPSWFNNYEHAEGRGIRVSDASQYNKVYPTRVHSTTPEQVSEGDVWESDSFIEIWYKE